MVNKKNVTKKLKDQKIKFEMKFIEYHDTDTRLLFTFYRSVHLFILQAYNQAHECLSQNQNNLLPVVKPNLIFDACLN